MRAGEILREAWAELRRHPRPLVAADLAARAAGIVILTPLVLGLLQLFLITTDDGIVTGDAILGANVFRDLFAGIRDLVGGRSGAYEEELAKARRIAIEELIARLAQTHKALITVEQGAMGGFGAMVLQAMMGQPIREGDPEEATFDRGLAPGVGWQYFAARK